MIALGIDTSTGTGSVGLTDGGALSSELNLRNAMTHSSRLLPAVQALTATTGVGLDEIGVVSVACGPGSFTGVRIGIATAKGLALSMGRPVIGFSTLETIACACAATWPAASRMPVCVLLDAGKGEVYRGLFACRDDDVRSIEPESAMHPSEAARRIPDECLICGNGVPACGAYLAAGGETGRVFTGTIPFIGLALARRALAAASRGGLESLPPLRPNYLRASEAEIHFRG